MEDVVKRFDVEGLQPRVYAWSGVGPELSLNRRPEEK